MHSSLGFHTMTVVLILKYNDMQQLIRDFRRYSQATGLIQIYHVDRNGKGIRYHPTKDKAYMLPTHLKITYFKEDRGIKWSIRCNTNIDSFRSYFVEATINAKILGGITDYITAATYDDMEMVIKNFNLESERISPLLKNFDYYSIKRIDYCINFSINELLPKCSPEQVMTLIKRGNIPPHYKEWKKYDTTSHRMKSESSSLYLINSSVNINCYMKHVELQERLCKNETTGYSMISQATVNEALDIIRFEVQCKYLKTYILNSKAEESGNHDYNKYESLLTPEACNEEINYYFKKTIGKGNWYTLQDAVRIIQSHYFNKQKENRLIEALRFVNQCRSLAKAKATYQGSDLDAFKRTLKDLAALNINPVTIPREWGIRHIPNLLYAYYDKQSDEKNEKEVEEFLYENFKQYIKKYGLPD
ncbi:MAG: hypothetical protein J1E98_11515 [Lachnospiraceae bacterium]|nr:hypothetical protein [Lachnospiraceae bacterium]